MSQTESDDQLSNDQLQATAQEVSRSDSRTQNLPSKPPQTGLLPPQFALLEQQVNNCSRSRFGDIVRKYLKEGNLHPEVSAFLLRQAEDHATKAMLSPNPTDAATMKLYQDMLLCDTVFDLGKWQPRTYGGSSYDTARFPAYLAVAVAMFGCWTQPLPTFGFLVFFLLGLTGAGALLQISLKQTITSDFAPGWPAHRPLLQNIDSGVKTTADGTFQGRNTLVRFLTQLGNCRRSGLVFLLDQPLYTIAVACKSIPFTFRVSRRFAKCNLPRHKLRLKSVPLNAGLESLLLGLQIEADDPLAIARWLQTKNQAALALSALFADCLIDFVEINNGHLRCIAHAHPRGAAERNNTRMVLNHACTIAAYLENASQPGTEGEK
jgi:hypothetical protein